MTDTSFFHEEINCAQLKVVSFFLKLFKIILVFFSVLFQLIAWESDQRHATCDTAQRRFCFDRLRGRLRVGGQQNVVSELTG